MMLVGLDLEKEHSARMNIQHDCMMTTGPDLLKTAYEWIIATFEANSLIFSNYE
jgi:hypothetical protein